MFNGFRYLMDSFIFTIFSAKLKWMQVVTSFTTIILEGIRAKFLMQHICSTYRLLNSIRSIHLHESHDWFTYCPLFNVLGLQAGHFTMDNYMDGWIRSRIALTFCKGIPPAIAGKVFGLRQGRGGGRRSTNTSPSDSCKSTSHLIALKHGYHEYKPQGQTRFLPCANVIVVTLVTRHMLH